MFNYKSESKHTKAIKIKVIKSHIPHDVLMSFMSSTNIPEKLEVTDKNFPSGFMARYLATIDPKGVSYSAGRNKSVTQIASSLQP